MAAPATSIRRCSELVEQIKFTSAAWARITQAVRGRKCRLMQAVARLKAHAKGKATVKKQTVIYLGESNAIPKV